MSVCSLSDLADLATIIGVAAALVTAAVGYSGWRHKARHSLYIPAPNVLSQDPGDPDFWVFPPTRMDDGAYAVVIAGKVVNAGPSDAFSVRVYVEPEYSLEQGVPALEAAIDTAVNLQKTNGDVNKKIKYSFYEAYKNRNSFIPVLPVGKEQPFVVIARLEPGTAYLESLLEKGEEGQISLFWTIDGKQAHGVHARSRTAQGKELRFGPNDLCAPFEDDRRWLPRKRGSRLADREA
jgi:hypothetical protein